MIKSTKFFCFVAFHVLERFLDHQKPDQDILASIPEVTVPLFVTYHIDGDHLRGCIGNLGQTNFRESLPEYAVIAAVRDHRFNPISKQELPRLNVAVSMLVEYEQAKDALDWEVGKHGIIINYNGYSATFLPEVAAEQGWDRRTTLQHLLLKAGVKERLTDAMVKEIKTTRYQSSKEHLTYQEYEQMKASGPPKVDPQ